MKKGFTLIELLVSATIIMTLAAIGLVSYSAIAKRSRDAKRKGDIEQFRSALEMYRSDNGYYPNAGGGSWTDAQGGSSLLYTPLVGGGYLPALPADPKSTPRYRYRATSLSGGQYYGYCLEANLEAEDPADTCSPQASHNYGVKNP